MFQQVRNFLLRPVSRRVAGSGGEALELLGNFAQQAQHKADQTRSAKNPNI
jgi:hypothetical protein